jgi:dienelactone hydrolase
MFLYEGTEHAFANHHRPEVYAPDATALAWERTLDFLREHLH